MATKPTSKQPIHQPNNSCILNALPILPWQKNIWEQVINAHHIGRLHHAYLISGIAGLGKLHFACNLAHSLLCQAATMDGTPCNKCRNCHLFKVGNHPDLHQVSPDPESKSGEIGIDAIRKLADLDEISSHSGRYKIIIIAPADHLNRHAANSLLKTLEEPSASTILLLVTARPERLLPTIRSRCQYLPFTVPKEKDALDWLKVNVQQQQDSLLALRLAHGAPLVALDWLKIDLLQKRQEIVEKFFELSAGKVNPIMLAETWMQEDLVLLLGWIGSWVADVLRLQSGAQFVSLENPDLKSKLMHYTNNLNAVKLHKLWSKIIQSRRQLQTNVNSQLLLETILIQWSEV